jgi:hypothetical protein
MNAHAKTILDKLKDDQDDNLKANLTEILRKGGFADLFSKMIKK